MMTRLKGSSSRRRSLGPVLGGLLLSAMVQLPTARGVLYQFVGSFGQECTPCPAGGSPGTGTANFILDGTTHIASYNITYGGMAGIENNAHVHGPATQVPCVNGGIVYGLPAGQPKIGNSPVLSAAQVADMKAGRHYVNIHTSVCGGGEIRAQIFEVPQACCLPGGGCIMSLVDPCIQQGGTPQGPDSLCLGDNNGNLIDDACEYENWVIADDFMIMPGGGGATPPITDVRWCGSWLDPDFDPKLTPAPRRVDGWLVALHRDVPPQPCPAGTNYDACGFVDTSPPCPRFTPEGSATSIPLATAACGVPGCVIPPAGYWRICAEYLPNCTLACAPAPGALCVRQFLPCDTGISRPSDLIAQWVFDEPEVPAINAGKAGCDQHNIFCWGPVPLSRACLVHNCAGPDEINPLNPGVFNPRPNDTYWISFQAEVGHKVVRSPQPCCIPGGGCQMFFHADCLAQGGIPQAGAVCTVTTCNPPGPAAPPLPCTEIATGNTVIRDFWGWHTTPPGYHQKDDAFMGFLAMGCRMEWLYHWMNHLHWSQPPYHLCADDPTKSIDMAFSLYDFINGQTLWYQPTNPGPPPIPPPPFPPDVPRLPPIGGIDELVNTIAQVQIEIFGFGFGNVNAQGPTRIQRSNPIIGPPDFIQTEIIAMNLVGISPFGPSTVIERFDQHSPGITQMPGPGVPLQSFFDVFVEIQSPGAPPGLQNLITQGPIQVNAIGGIWEVPPSLADYQGPPGGPVTLVDRSNPLQPVGRLHFVSHRVVYRGGIDIHSDVDWRNAPAECTCHGDLNVDSRLDGADIQLFVTCMLLQLPPPLGCPCDCADMDDDNDIDGVDLVQFVNQLLQNPKVVCPPIVCP